MAYTKVSAIRKNLWYSVAYATNEKKTGLDGAIEYAVNPSKTEHRLFESCLNLRNVKTAYSDMNYTKKRWNKKDGILGFHFIQSFAPGEVTPEIAHEIGVEFARRCFGEKFEVVIGTHLDREHYHNHIIVNSVSFVDGSKYHSTHDSYYNKIRVESDKLCEEYGLSKIENPKGKSKHYVEWKTDKEDKPTIRKLIRGDVDNIIRHSYNFNMFIDNLKKAGYTIKYGDKIKYIAVKPPNSERFIRLKSLGADYTEEKIEERIISQRYGIEPIDNLKIYHVRGNIRKCKRKKVKGFQALCLHYMYLLKKIQSGKPKQNKVPYEEVLKFERYKRQFKFMCWNNIVTDADLIIKKIECEKAIAVLTENRKEIPVPQREDINNQLRELRKELSICKNIEHDIAIIRDNLIEIKTKQKNIDERLR